MPSSSTAGSFTDPGRVVTIHDCIATYWSRPGGLYPFDVQRLDEFDAIASPKHARHGAWLHSLGQGSCAIATRPNSSAPYVRAAGRVDRQRATAVPSLPAVRGIDGWRIAYLTPPWEARLLASYSDWAAPVMLMVCEFGLPRRRRGGDWRQVDWQHAR